MSFKMWKQIIVTGIVLLALDAAYISQIKDMFNKQVIAVQGSTMQIRYSGAILCYILLILGVYYFILKHRRSVMDAFLLGLLVYGVYETTNYATLKNWKWSIVAMDTLWGGVLFATTAWIVKRIFLI